jgi:predicted metal-binding membrane protein
MATISLSRPTIQRRSAWRRTWWAHPELTLAGVALLAWVGVVGYHAAAALSSPADMDMTHHGMETHSATPGFLESVVLWIVMATAMMLPTALVEARFIALNGKWSRRQRGPVLFAAAYLTVWSAAGVVVFAAIWSLRPETTSLWALSAILAAAAGWELTRWKRHLLLGCHRLRAIPPTSWKADRACVTEGMRNGLSCVGACGPMMVSMAVAPHQAAIWLMIPLAGVIGIEKLLTKGVRYIRYVAAGLAVAAVGILGIACLAA